MRNIQKNTKLEWLGKLMGGKVSLLCGVELHTSCSFEFCLCSCHIFKKKDTQPIVDIPPNLITKEPIRVRQPVKV